MHDLARTAIATLRVDYALIQDFFVIYSRFEYAAKKNGHVEKSAGIVDLKLSQSSLANGIETAFIEKLVADADLSTAVAYYEATPPKKQVWNNGPDWLATTQTESRCTCLLIWLSRTRNNLFHGGKGYAAEATEIGRDEALLRHGITIMQAVLDCDPALRTSFET